MPFNDIGKFVGRYFQVLAWLSIISMIVSLIFFDYFVFEFDLRFTFIFILLFWAAHHLIRHNATARNWTIGITGFYVALIILTLLFASLVGTEGMSVTLDGRIIENPSIGQVATVAMPVLLLVGMPLGLLLTPKARREFGVVGGPLSADEASQTCQ
ncbi:hypothetical protein CA54_12080 [Symmachiella macrocystis]|uniref:Uncharacterized protein n=1 Tax=Symmachiella macrocystis TaxID=2527985 RepID=A0A5C6BP71_9PLAN|nr:hypothetical protein [Symmachiella macrocystis]TWU12384.1 hypothetical protein CA54_12080 [Symmachiella macrocystis]